MTVLSKNKNALCSMSTTARPLQVDLYSSSMLLATSSMDQRRKTQVERMLVNDDRPLLSDRQKPLSHLKPRAVMVSTVRVVMKQVAESLAHYLSDKLEKETETDKLVDKGKLTVKEADQQVNEWEDNEWAIRTKAFPNKAWTALWKFHVATLLCRLYEGITDVWFHNDVALDKLTQDVFKSGIRTSKQKEGEARPIIREMFVTCLWANAFLYLADFSIHEIIITVSWYRIQKHRRLKRDETMDEIEDESSPPKKELAVQSTSLAVSRIVGWIAASAGGAVGTVLYPGWGTLVGVNMGDSAVASLFET